MAFQSSAMKITLALVPCLFLIMITPLAQAQKAPAPAPPGLINLTAILEKGGQYTTLMRLLSATQISNQIENQLNSSDQGMTLFAPTDNSFNNLKPGTLNGLSTQQQVELILYHVLPKYYSLTAFQTVSNPVRTQATGSDGGQFGLNFTTSANQVNVSTGVVETQLNNVVRQEFPLAVYSVDKVLLPLDLFGEKPISSAPPSPKGTAPSKKSPPAADEPSPSEDSTKSGSSGNNVGFSLFVGIGSILLGFLSS